MDRMLSGSVARNEASWLLTANKKLVLSLRHNAESSLMLWSKNRQLGTKHFTHVRTRFKVL